MSPLQSLQDFNILEFGRWQLCGTTRSALPLRVLAATAGPTLLGLENRINDEGEGRA